MIRHALAAVLVVLVLVLLVIEGLLQVFDPWGTRGIDAWATVAAGLVEHPTRDYALQPGTYILPTWRVTELPGYTRRIPDNPGGPCQVVFLGDSVTFATGVDDGAAWVNLVARELSQVDAINPAFNGYNSDQIRRLWSEYPAADVGVYLVIENDDAATENIVGRMGWIGEAQQMSMLSRYLIFLNTANAKTADDAPRFARDLDALAGDPRIVFVAFDGAFGRRLAGRWRVHLIPPYTQRISVVDSHANAEGNREIAQAMLPIVKEAVQNRCTAVF